jgi:DNA-binding transcriptional ArsR family regulator
MTIRTRTSTRPSPGPSEFARAARILKLLGHPERLRILSSLRQGELTVSELCEACGLEQAICSQHLRRLRRLRVVAGRKAGPKVHYRVIEPRVGQILGCIAAGRPRPAAAR